MRSITGELQVARPGALDVRSILSRAGREVWLHFPAWLFFFYGCLLLNTELTNLDPPRGELAYTAIFPLSVFALYYAVRAARAPEVARRSALLTATLGLCLVLPLLNLAYHRPSPLSLASLRLVYELSTFAWAALLVAHAARRHPSHIGLFFGVALVYGAMLENGGIVLGFFSEHQLDATRLPLLKAPLATMVGWCVVLYMASFVVWGLRRHLPWLRRSALLSALAVGAAATLLDLQLDPLASAAGCWVWHDSLPPAFHGVPMVNFVAWMCAITPFAYVMFRYQQRAGIPDGAQWTGRQLAFALLLVPATLGLAALAFIAAMGLAEGIDGPSWTLLNAFTDGVLAKLG